MQSLKFWALPFAIFAGLILVEIAWACSFAPLAVELRCPSDEYARTIMYYAHHFQDEDVEAKIQEELYNGIKALAQRAADCGLDVTIVQQNLEAEYRQWLQAHASDTPTWNLIFEPYSLNLEQELETRQRDLFSCYYADYERLGDWLVLTKRWRSYCHPNIFVFCGADTVFLIGLLGYAFSHMSWVTLPYILGYITLPLLGIGVLRQVLKYRLFKPILVADILLIFPVSGILVFSPLTFGLVGQLIGWGLGCYLVARVARFFEVKWRSSPGR